MKKIIISFFILLPFLLIGQDKFTISGYIEDAKTGEKLIEGNVWDDVSNSGTTSNLYGFYSITLPKDTVKISFSYMGYATQSFELFLDKDITLNVPLSDDLTLDVVTVTAESAEKIENETQMSKVEVPIEQIKKIPPLLGEVDVLKAMQLLPGVQSGGEGTSGLYVRGGSPDQNLILLDGVPVYNVSHLFGFFSVFNADAIKNVTLTKGGFPARYGGRLSSVLDISMKEGNLREYHGEGSIGIIASKLTLEGPIVKEKTSFLVSARRTYIDLLARPFIKQQLDGETTGYYFYDLNAKINHKFNDKHRLYASAYTGKDVFYLNITDSNYEEKGGFDWGNITSALRWNWMINNQLFANTTLTYSRYRFDVGTESTETDNGETFSFAAKYFSGIEDFAAKIDFDYMPDPNHYIRFGANAIHHTFSPGALQYQIEDGDNFNLDTIIGTSDTRAWEYFAYIEDDLKIGDNFSANIGFHFSAFTVNNKTYYSPQARIGARYLLPKSFALKASYAMMTQYIHLLTNEGIGLPTDLWVPSTENITPQDSWQVALGLAKTFGTEYEVSIEGYYKKMNNLLSYKEGASFFSFSDWQTKVTQGVGDSYGVEFFVQKKKGNTTGWLGYTLSWNNRQFEEINSGKEYPFKYDRRHDLSIVLSHSFNDKISVSGTWVYGTGNSITLNEVRYLSFNPNNNNPGLNEQDEIEVPGSKNNYRMDAYHRLDIGIDFRKEKKRYERTFSLGAYNLYSRKNPFYIYYNSSENTFKQVSIFPIIPYFTYKFKF